MTMLFWIMKQTTLVGTCLLMSVHDVKTQKKRHRHFQRREIFKPHRSKHIQVYISQNAKMTEGNLPTMSESYLM